MNKSSYERGFAHATVYKTSTKTLNENMGKMNIKSAKHRMLNRKIYPEDRKFTIPDYIDNDGLPLIGTPMKQGMIEFVYIDKIKNCLVTNLYKDSEPSHIEEIRFFQDSVYSEEISVVFKYRYSRNLIQKHFSQKHFVCLAKYKSFFFCF